MQQLQGPARSVANINRCKTLGYNLERERERYTHTHAHTHTHTQTHINRYKSVLVGSILDLFGNLSILHNLFKYSSPRQLPGCPGTCQEGMPTYVNWLRKQRAQHPYSNGFGWIWDGFGFIWMDLGGSGWI